MPDYSVPCVIQPLPGIGDMVWHIPHLKALAAANPTGKISLITKASSQATALFKGASWLNDIYSLSVKDTKRWRRTFKIRHALHKLQPHHVWILHHSPRYALAAWLAGVPVRYGYGLGRQERYLTTGPYLSPAGLQAHNITKADEFLRLHGMAPQMQHKDLTSDPEAQEAVMSQCLGLPRPWVILGIGSTEISRCWSAYAYTTLIKGLHDAYGGTYFLSGGPMDMDFAARVLKNLPVDSPIKALPATHFSLLETIALYDNADIFIGNDSGPMNIMAALGKPTYCLFPTEHVLSYRPNIISITPPLSSPQDLHHITPTMVLERVAL